MANCRASRATALPADPLDPILQQLAAEIAEAPRQVSAAVELLDGGATVPFIARCRKEATGGLDDVQLRTLASRLVYLRELQARRAAVLESIEGQGKLTPALRAAIEAASTKQEVEDLYLPLRPRRRTKGTIAREAGLDLIAIGNGTASRETDRLAADLIARSGANAIDRVVVREAGASVYSASELASRELPDLDVSLRGAVSIARRVQDPLAELVKIDPRSIGVGQYQHDVDQAELARALDAVVEDCVNAVGVDLNTASAPLLARVAGLSAAVAAAIVRWRDANGMFRQRRQLLDVSGLGPRAFEQAAGFLRVHGGDDPLDASGVHPEAYPLVQRLLEGAGCAIGELMGRSDMLRRLRPEAFADERFGAITVRDVIAELEKPGRDPRPHFQVARFNPGVDDIADLVPGMVLDGTVSNLTQFGAFVDLGVHQDGLVHVSQLAAKFVRDARELVKAGDSIKARVVEVDLARRRIALSMKPDARAAEPDRSRGRPPRRGHEPPAQGALAAAFARAKPRG
jgi:uncharacterized protein